MRKAENSNAKDKDTSSFEAPRHRPHWLAAFTCLVFGILIAVAMFDFEPAQSIQHTTNPTSVNLVGVIGAEYSWWIFHLLGGTAWLIPVFLLRMAFIYLRRARSLATTRLLAIICCLISFSALMAMQETIFTSKVNFKATFGTQYRIAVDGRNGAMGVIQLLDRFRRRIKRENLMPFFATKRHDDLYHRWLVIDNYDLRHGISALRIFYF